MNETLNIQNGVSPITIDTKVTEGSTRPVMGGGIYEAIASVAEPFVVELTPTSPDLSVGMTDKTVGEIYDAYQAGKKIVFQLSVEGLPSLTVDRTAISFAATYQYPSFAATFCFLHPELGGCLAFLFTPTTNDRDYATYEADIYPLSGLLGS